MANNRLFLHCKVCNHYVYFAKYYPTTGWYIQDIDNLDTDLDRHRSCYTTDVYNNELFDLQYETTLSAEEWNRATP